MQETKKIVKYLLDGVAFSYSQIFFSDKKWFGMLMLLFTLINPIKTIVGVSSVVIALGVGMLFNFNKELLKSGVYTYNGLLVGLGIASLYDFTPKIIIVITFYSVLSLFLSVWSHSLLKKRNLPFLTIPFLLCIWLIHMSSSAYGQITHNTNIELIFNFVKPVSDGFSNFVDLFYFKDFLHILFKCISAIFFIYNDLVGFLILVALLFYSRISFSLAIIGFTVGFFFFWIFLEDYKVLVINHVGFNFVLISIALGGFFIVPSVKSYLLQIFSTSLSCILLGALTPVFALYLNAPVYSLPFVMVVIIVLSALQQRTVANGIEIVTNQQSQPELNLYKNYYDKLRFKANTYYHVYLPVMGEWTISQGIDGGITHLNQWKYAWDFDVRNQENKTYLNEGINLKDFLCYDLPVTAPVSGYVVAVLDNVVDNHIGEINTVQNWGNTIVIKIENYFYVQLSHFKPESILVNVGDYVTVGQTLGSCGSSGRSPEPHIHFQFQTTPAIGSKTIPYPIAYYLSKTEDNQLEFHSFDYPKENQKVLNVVANKGMQNAFAFFPNHTLELEIERNNKVFETQWTIHIDGFNRSYFYDAASKSCAYFNNDGVLFYFYDFIGDKKSELFLFYLALQKIILAPNLNCIIKDWIMPTYVLNTAQIWLQDFIAPFYQPVKGKYHSRITAVDQIHYPKEIEIESIVYSHFLKSNKEFLKCKTTISNQNITSLEIEKNNAKTIIKCKKILPFY